MNRPITDSVTRDSVLSKIAEFAARIKNFETEAGECFADYFLDDNVFKTSWAFWLIGKGYNDRGGMIVDMINTKGRSFSDNDLVFNIHASPKGNGVIVKYADYDTAHDNDLALWAEFLMSTDRYFKPFLEYLENFEAGNSY